MSNAACWRISAAHCLELDRPRLVGIINTTPDSFSDGGLALDPSAAAQRAAQMVEDGADALDIGAASTRPGAQSVPDDQQIARAVPAIEAIRARGVDLPITIDTTSIRVARAALDAGADAINDVSAAESDPQMLTLAAERACSIILMHRLAPPAKDVYSTQYPADPDYASSGGVVSAIADYLASRVDAARKAGIPSESIVLDPGLGFGKSVGQNVALMRETARITDLGHPVLVGASRKSFIGALSGEPEPSRRVAGSVAAAVMMAGSGVRLFRVHDVREHAAALRVAQSLLNADIPHMEQSGAGRSSPC